MDKKELRKFAVILAVICVVLGTLRIRAGSEKLHIVLFSLAGYAILSAIFYPRAISPVYILLTKIGEAVSWVMTRLILGIVFYFVLTPIGLLLRIFRKDLLGIKIKDSDKTYWVRKEKIAFDPKKYENQF